MKLSPEEQALVNKILASSKEDPPTDPPKEDPPTKSQEEDKSKAQLELEAKIADLKKS